MYMYIHTRVFERMKSYLLYYTSKRLSLRYNAVHKYIYIYVYGVAKQHPYYVDLSATDDPLLIGTVYRS